MSNSNQSVSNKRTKNGNQELQVMTAFQGPLPSPEILQGFENVLPGAAERIMTMAEKEQSSRHSLEKKVSTASVIAMIIGVVFAFLGLLIVSGLIYYSLTLGNSEVAIALATTALGTVVMAFLGYRKVRKKQEQN